MLSTLYWIAVGYIYVHIYIYIYIYIYMLIFIRICICICIYCTLYWITIGVTIDGLCG